ncbi:hypothetical protein ACQX5V_23545, partial [Salmonella enterica]
LDPHVPVSTLSGGQLTRLRLLALFARPAHFLLLDEPDNHLDARGIEVVVWLIKQQKVSRPRKQRQQAQTGELATAQGADRD